MTPCRMVGGKIASVCSDITNAENLHLIFRDRILSCSNNRSFLWLELETVRKFRVS